MTLNINRSNYVDLTFTPESVIDPEKIRNPNPNFYNLESNDVYHRRVSWFASGIAGHIMA